MMVALALILALIPPPAPAAPAAASPGPSASPRVLKTIVTVKSSPYCNALADHFNAALVPMIANDRVFAVVDVQLDDMNDMFKYPDYANRFMDLRAKLLKETATLDASLPPMHDEIVALRESGKLTTDPGEAKEMSDAAAQLQDAYLHQMQLSTDLTGVVQAMMRYNILRGPHPLGGWTPYENTLPADEKNIKSFLHYGPQVNSVDMAENHAVDIATNAAQTHCASASPPPK